MKVYIFLVISLFFCITPSYQQKAGGLEVVITNAGVTRFETIGNLLMKLLLENEHFKLPDDNLHVPDFKFNLTDLLVEKTTFDNFTLAISPNEGLLVTLSNLQINLNYTLSYHRTFPSTSGNFSSAASAKVIKAGFLLKIKANESGKPILTFSSSSITLGDIKLGIPGTFGEFIEILTPLFSKILDWIIPDYVVPDINAQLTNYTQGLTTTMFLDPNNSTTIDIGLAQDPVFSAENITFILRGDSYANHIRNTCPYQVTSRQTQTNSGNTTELLVQGYASESVFNCILLAFLESGALNETVQKMVDQVLTTDNRLTLALDFLNDNSSNIKIVPGGVQGNFHMNAEIYQGKGANAIKFITLDVHLHTFLTASIDHFKLFPNMENLTVNLNVTQFNGPDQWAQQIFGTDFAELDARANDFLSTTVLPQINTPLSEGFVLPIPQEAQALLAGLQLQFLERTVLIGFN